MGESHDPTPVGVVNPNAAVIAGLREVADLLEQHPELPAVWWASLSLRERYAKAARDRARDELTAVAAAFGDRAVETRQGSDISIEARFSGDVRLHADADINDLRDEPPLPEYDPIIAHAAEGLAA